MSSTSPEDVVQQADTNDPQSAKDQPTESIAPLEENDKIKMIPPKEEIMPLETSLEKPSSHKESPAEQLELTEATENKSEAKDEEFEMPLETDSSHKSEECSSKTDFDLEAAKDSHVFKKPDEPSKNKNKPAVIAGDDAADGPHEFRRSKEPEETSKDKNEADVVAGDDSADDTHVFKKPDEPSKDKNKAAAIAGDDAADGPHLFRGSKEPEETSKDKNEADVVAEDDSADDTHVFRKPDEPSKDKIEAAAAPTTGVDCSEHAEHVTYDKDGNAIYTDPTTKYKYKWCEKDNNWIPIAVSKDGNEAEAGDAAKVNPYENEHYKWCNETQTWKPKATQVTETEHYKWDAEKNAWIPKQQLAKEGKDGIIYSVDKDGQRIYTDKDGVVFFWDEEKSAWFPKIDDEFMARYQMNYGFIDNVSAGEEEKRKKAEVEEKRKAEELKRMAEEAREAMESSAAAGGSSGSNPKRKANQEPPKWFEIDEAHNTKVYVSNLPLDITLDEFAELMGKCGMIMRDPQTQKFKLKLYTEADGQIKGDGLCDYIKVESVNLALSILDEYVYRGNKIHVQPAKFQMRGEYNPSLKPKRKKKDKEKLQKMKEKLFDWRPEKMRGERTKNEKVVIIKNLFTPDIFEKEVELILEYQNDLREECGKCGTVRKVVIYDCHPEGVAQINMATPEEADLVIQMMQGRYFGKRQLSAEHWDGKTKYKIFESEKDAQKRLSNWDEFLETDAEKMEKTDVTC